MRWRRSKIKAALRRFRQSDDGASAIEYALVAGGIALAIIIVVFAIGDQVFGLYESVETAFEGG